ncbi:hypothetical protein [Yinghuangia seranimata]|uniref:hypothetical protein n=1 Tax=Yinghuangia seranimata TaxID=408067 RepID=UPI00248ABFE9|nr:hypothetical protein [Yinghuangia seranimata]MDI2128675.1 hypothetical protein [Yinghuangia seranimata]
MSAIRYELARLRTVRTTWLAAFGVLALGAAATWVEARDFNAVPARAGEAAQLITSGAGASTPLAVMAVVFLAVRSCTREHRAVSLPSLLIALPRRTRSLVGKALVTALVAAGVAVAGLVVNASVAAAEFGPGFQSLVWDQVPAPRLLAGYVGYVVLAALFGLGVGVVTRGSAAAAVALVALPLAVEPLAARAAELAVPAPYRDWVRYLPFNAADRMLAIGGGGGLSPTAGALTFGAWTLAALLLAVVVFARRDA